MGNLKYMNSGVSAKLVPVIVPKQEVQLTLSLAAAKDLHDVLGPMSGEASAKSYAVYSALDDVLRKA